MVRFFFLALVQLNYLCLWEFRAELARFRIVSAEAGELRRVGQKLLLPQNQRGGKSLFGFGLLLVEYSLVVLKHHGFIVHRQIVRHPLALRAAVEILDSRFELIKLGLSTKRKRLVVMEASVVV